MHTALLCMPPLQCLRHGTQRDRASRASDHPMNSRTPRTLRTLAEAPPSSRLCCPGRSGIDAAAGAHQETEAQRSRGRADIDIEGVPLDSLFIVLSKDSQLVDDGLCAVGERPLVEEPATSRLKVPES